MGCKAFGDGGLYVNGLGVLETRDPLVGEVGLDLEKTKEHITLDVLVIVCIYQSNSILKCLCFERSK